MYITLAELFQYAMVLIAFATLLLSVFGHKRK